MADIPFTNPTPSFSSSNPTGTGTTLNYIGDHVYAYSGFYTAADSTNGVNVLTFTTGNHYIVGTLTFNGYAAVDEPTYGTDGACELKLNDQVVAVLKNGTASEVMPTNTVCNILLPPYTKVNVRIEADGSNSTVGATVVLMGRMH